MSNNKDKEQQTAAVPQADTAAEANKIPEETKAQAVESAAKAEKLAGKAGGTATTKPGEELVTIELFKDGERYKDDVFVAVNGKSFQIKRGEPVKVPGYVAAVLEQSRRQDTATAGMIDRKSAEYAAQAKALNI